MALSAEVKYRVLLELSRRISRTLDLDAVLDEILSALRSTIDCDAAGVFVLRRAVPLLRREDESVIAGMAHVGFDTPRPDDPMLRSGKGIVGHVILTGRTVNARDVRADPRYVAGRASTLSELAVPITAEAGVFGCLNVESDRLEAFSSEDEELVEFFAGAAAASIEKALLHRQVLEKQRLEHQLQVAREVQSALLPTSPPALAGWDVAAVNLPTGAIGGDYYDYVPLEEGQLGLVVADVSGKGVPAALIMASFRATLRQEIRRHVELGVLASRLNRAVIESRDAARFVTAVCGVLDPGSGRLAYVNCGHNPPLLLRSAGDQATTLRAGGPALGLLEEGAFEAGETVLAPGDCLVLYTDGVVEPTDEGDREFGVERLDAAVRAASGRPASDALQAVVEATRAFSGRERYDDDFTLVIVRRMSG